MTSPVTILLVDDEPMLRRATALLLTNRGGRVTAAESADEAVALAAARPYDVAILDLSPRGPTHADVLRRMRAGGAVPARVIAVSDGALDPPWEQEIAAVFCKPYAFDLLLAAVFPRRAAEARPSSPPRGRRAAPRRALVTPPARRRVPRAGRDRG